MINLHLSKITVESTTTASLNRVLRRDHRYIPAVDWMRIVDNRIWMDRQYPTGRKFKVQVIVRGENSPDPDHQAQRVRGFKD